MNYRVIVERAAQKQVIKLGLRQGHPLIRALFCLRNDLRPVGSRKLIGGDDFWRIKVGHLRIIYTIDDVELIIRIVRVARRSESTYKGLQN